MEKKKPTYKTLAVRYETWLEMKKIAYQEEIRLTDLIEEAVKEFEKKKRKK